MSKKEFTYNPGWLGLLGVIFILAKVFEIAPVAEWSWWLVLLPFYVGLAIFLGVILFGASIFAIIYGALKMIEKYQSNKRRAQLEKQRTWDRLKK